jgi:hypothetical protein
MRLTSLFLLIALSVNAQTTKPKMVCVLNGHVVGLSEYTQAHCEKVGGIWAEDNGTQPAPPATEKAKPDTAAEVTTLCNSLQVRLDKINADTGRKFEVMCSEQLPQPKPREKVTIPLTSDEKVRLAYWRAVEDAGWGAEYNFERDLFIAHGVMFNDTGRWTPKGMAFSNTKCDVTPMIIANTDFITLDKFGFWKPTPECSKWTDELWRKFSKPVPSGGKTP